MGIAALALAFTGAPPGLRPFRFGVAPAIGSVLGARLRVALPVAPALALAAGLAELAVRFVGVASASGAEPPCQPVSGPLPGASVFGLAGLGIAHARDACPAAGEGPGAVGEPAFLGAIAAEGPAGFGGPLSTPRAEAPRGALGGALPGALAVAAAPCIEIRVWHDGVSSDDKRTATVGRPVERSAGAGQRRCLRSPHREQTDHPHFWTPERVPSPVQTMISL